MVEDVIDALSQGVNVHVLASSATAGFHKGAITDLPAIARQLGVRYLLEGNVRRAGANLRVTSQLVDAASSAILWTQKFERALSELAALQEDLVLEVAANLDAQVYRIEMERALKKPADLTAWEAVMRSIAAYRRVDGESFLRAVEEAKRALSIAPDYGLAHAMFAFASSMVYCFLSPDNIDEVRRIRGHVDRALALDPNNASVLAYAACALSVIGQPEEAYRHAERAVQLSPSAGWAHLAWGVACCMLNCCDEAMQHLDAELRVSPGSKMRYISYGWKTVAHMSAGRWYEATMTAEQALVLEPNYAHGCALKGIACSHEGYPDEARRMMARAREIEPRMTLALWELIWRRLFARSLLLEEVLFHFQKAWAATGIAA